VVSAARTGARGRPVHDRDRNGRRDRRANLERLLELHGAIGLKGWQWLFLLEGLPAILLAPVVLLYMTEKPADAKWLTAPEREWLAGEIAAEQAETGHAIVTLGAALGSARLWIVSLPYFCIVIAFYGISFFLPQILQSVSGFGSGDRRPPLSNPYISATIGLVVVGTRDRIGCASGDGMSRRLA
jgi:ACS family tartrate transporter-like MFS transporter